MTSKAIPAALLATYQKRTRALTFLIRIEALDGTVAGLTSAEDNIDYNDGAGSVTYSAPIGFDPEAFESSSDMSVDNSEATVLMSTAGIFSSAQIEAGVLDFGAYKVYRVNRLDLSEGHEIVDFGTFGIAKRINGVSAHIELRSLSQQGKQTYGQLYSTTCRARFGSGGGGTCLLRGQCGFDADSLWQNHSVDAVGTEADRLFTADGTPAVNGPNGPLGFAPGVVQWLTGNNAGKTSEVEATDAADITLRFGTAYDIEVGDTFKIRPDCDKTWETCRDDYDNQDNFRGEPKIPLTDESSQSTPYFGGIFSPVDSPDVEVP